MNDSPTPQERPGTFPVTRWTLVLAARGTPSPESAAALERLCAGYWFPLYAFARRSGCSPEDAEDSTQEFLARLLEHNWIAGADRDKGRFRSFLLMAMKRFLAQEFQRAKAVKRGGRVQFVPFQSDTAETRYSREPVDTRTPEQVFEKQWALTLLQTVLQRLRQDYVRDGKSELFEKLEPSLVGRRETQPYAALAAELGMAEGAIKVAVHRLRQRYRDCLKDEIAQTLASREDVDEELQYLFQVLSRP